MSERPIDHSPAAAYQRVFVPAIFQPLAEAILDIAAPGPGEHVLDLGTGTGVVARAIAPIVGPTGSVTAIDVKEQMIDVARSISGTSDTVEWLVADAADIPLPDDCVDLVVAQQVLQYLPDRRAALDEVVRLLRSGGRLVATVWRSLEHQPLMNALTRVEARHVEPLGLSWADVAQPFMWSDPDEIRQVIESAGLAVVEMREIEIQTEFAASTFVEDLEMAYASVIPAFIEDRAAFDRFIASVTADVGSDIDAFRVGDRLRAPMRSHVIRAIAS